MDLELMVIIQAPAPRVSDARDADVIGRPLQGAASQQCCHVGHAGQPPPPLAPRKLPPRLGAQSRVVAHALHESGRHRRLVDRRPAGSRCGAASVTGRGRTRSTAGERLRLPVHHPQMVSEPLTGCIWRQAHSSTRPAVTPTEQGFTLHYCPAGFRREQEQRGDSKCHSWG